MRLKLQYEWWLDLCLNRVSVSKAIRYAAPWGRVTHVCVSNPDQHGSNNGLSPVRLESIIWTNVCLWSNGCQQILSKLQSRNDISHTQKNVIENGICEIVVLLPRPQCVLQNGGIFVSVSMCYCFLKNCFDVKGFNFVVHRKCFPWEQAGSMHVMIKDLRIPSCLIPTMSCLDSWPDACDSVHSRSRESSISFQHGESLHLKSSFYQNQQRGYLTIQTILVSIFG